MAETFNTIVVPAASASLARSLAASIEGGSGMFTTGLSATGSKPATHYISSGGMDGQICEAISASIPTADISTELPFVALSRLGLQVVRGSINGA